MQLAAIIYRYCYSIDYAVRQNIYFFSVKWDQLISHRFLCWIQIWWPNWSIMSGFWES